MSRLPSRLVLSLAGILIAAGCGDGSPADPEPKPEIFPPGIGFLEGNNATDTVGAVQGTQLLITVRTSAGGLAPNTLVQLEGIPLPGATGGVEVQTAPAVGGDFTDWATAVTDLRGTLSVRVRLGSRAGTGRLVVRVPALSLTDTARYTILPGAVARVRSFPEDTLVLMGGRVPLRVTAADRFGNPRTGDPVTFALASGPGTLAGSEVTAGTSIGQVTAVATVAGRSDTTLVRVVPAGMVAAPTSSATGHTAALYTFNLDGSNIRRVRTTNTGPGYNGEMSVAWLSPTRLVYHDNSWDHEKQVYVLDLETGDASRLLPPETRMDYEDFPRASRDGSWIYFGGGTFWRQAVHRARADGSGLEQVSPGADPFSEWGADPSPDGARIVYVKDGHNSGEEQLHVMDLASRVVTPLNLTGVSPRWSPDGTRIAYADQSANGPVYVAVANADGSGARVLSTTPVRGDVNWSPDGRYLVVAARRVSELMIIEVATGASVTVDYPAIVEGLTSPVWKP